jgi:hypothetical protein
MRRIFLLCASLLTLGATQAMGVPGPIIDWDPAYGWQAGGTPTNLPPGGEFKMVGTISMFGPPLDFLDASDPTVEYTFYIHGLISNGTVAIGPPATTIYSTTYNGGSMEVYYDTSPEASFDPNPPNAGVPADFTDGTLILAGNFTSFTVTSNNFTAYNVGDIQGNLVFTGGAYLHLLQTAGGEQCPGLLTGGATWYPPVMIPGYLFRHDGKLDLQCPTPARPSTWGRVKSLYR